MCFASCSRSHKCYFGVMHSYHPYSSTTRWSPGDRSARVCLCVCFCGAPWGEAGQSLPVAALGQGMAIQDTCLATGPNIILAPFVFILPLHTFPSPAMYSDPRFNPSVPKSPLLFHLHTYFCNLFYKIAHVSLGHSQSMSHARSLSTSVFWQGCISSLAVLLGGRLKVGCGVCVCGGGGSHGTSEYINSHQKANRAEWRLGALSCEWHWAAV